jgi:hypothetical protein
MPRTFWMGFVGCISWAFGDALAIRHLVTLAALAATLFLAATAGSPGALAQQINTSV